MGSLRLVLAGWFVAGLIGFANSQPASAAPLQPSGGGKLVGTWELVKGDPAGATVEFTQDHKLKFRAKIGEQTVTLEGTYSVNKDNLTVNLKTPDGKDQSETLTIKKLTDKELVIEEK